MNPHDNHYELMRKQGDEVKAIEIELDEETEVIFSRLEKSMERKLIEESFN